MIQHTRRAHLIALAGGLAACATRAETHNAYLGTWSGVLTDGTAKVRVRLTIASATSARVVILDQGSAEFEASTIALTTDGVTLDFTDLKDSFTGSLSGPDTLKLHSKEWANTFDFMRGDLWGPKRVTPESVAKLRSDSGVPALGVAYARVTGPVTILVDGLRSSEAAAPVTPSDRWLLNSVYKSMTASLVARLIEAGGITWDTTIADLLGDAIPGMQDSYRRATFRHLLSHHAGLQPNIADEDFVTFSRFPLDDARAERQRYAAFALKQTPGSAPGEDMRYANNGYIVAAAMLEARYGQRWEDLIADHVFRPLGITTFAFVPPGTDNKLDQPLGHFLPQDGKLIPGQPNDGQGNPYAMGPAGRISMNLADLTAYLRAHAQRTESFLTRASWSTLHTSPFTQGYAMGWFVYEDGSLAHSGATARWQTYAGFNPTTGVVACTATNAGSPMAAAAVAELYRDAMMTAAL